VWKNPVAAVKALFFDMVVNILSFIGNIAKGIQGLINKIPGVNIDVTSGIDNVINGFSKASKQIKQDNNFVTLSRFEQKDYGAAFNSGKATGEKIAGKAVSGVQWLGGKVSDMIGKLH